MHVRQENLPFLGSSHEFVGAEQGHAGVSAFGLHLAYSGCSTSEECAFEGLT